MITIIDYGAGNVRSIENMLAFFGCDYLVTSDEKKIESASALIFPGQGHFEQAVENLKRKNLVEPIKSFIASGKPFLGICLGFQILFEKSEEAPEFQGLSILNGEVKKFNTKKVPQIGWNKIETTKNNSFLENDYFYFVNSYYVKPDDKSIISSYSDYYGKFCASIEIDNICACQFHPEKSSDAGINFFKKWIEKI